jgi:RimJ/RimL family protein N-acetyltransferase
MSTVNQGYDKVGPMVEIRELTETDIDAVAALHVRTWQAGYAGIVPAAILDALDPARFAARRRVQPAYPGTHTVVADEDGTIVGFASFGPYRGDPGAGEVYAIYVDPKRWGGGVGRRLMATARATLSPDFREVRLWVLEENHRARRFYERAGMTPDGARDFYTPPGGDTGLPEIRYAMRLEPADH